MENVSFGFVAVLILFFTVFLGGFVWFILDYARKG